MIKAKKLSQRHYDIVDVQILQKPTDDQPADEQAQL
jgi:hypothetical protein